jgi:murein L,D-transpeptidase YafK
MGYSVNKIDFARSSMTKESSVLKTIRRNRFFAVYFKILVAAAVIFVQTAPVAADFPKGGEADKVVVEKAARRMLLLSDGQVLREYKIALGRCPVGPKTEEGDGKTPEGEYIIDYRNSQSRFHLALHISYPNAADIKRAQVLGVSPGNHIMIHGIRNGFGRIGKVHRLFDWTEGCIAVTNEEIQEIWRLVPDGTPIRISP